MGKEINKENVGSLIFSSDFRILLATDVVVCILGDKITSTKFTSFDGRQQLITEQQQEQQEQRKIIDVFGQKAKTNL